MLKLHGSWRAVIAIVVTSLAAGIFCYCFAVEDDSKTPKAPPLPEDAMTGDVVVHPGARVILEGTKDEGDMAAQIGMENFGFAPSSVMDTPVTDSGPVTDTGPVTDSYTDLSTDTGTDEDTDVGTDEDTDVVRTDAVTDMVTDVVRTDMARTDVVRTDMVRTDMVRTDTTTDGGKPPGWPPIAVSDITDWDPPLTTDDPTEGGDTP
ncbi:MAG: hypothetical protein PHE61_06815 [Candidatus Omnitrophica bacterium]|nr:hypothetical protein [Candidatus Omnitrophota bacterium]